MGTLDRRTFLRLTGLAAGSLAGLGTVRWGRAQDDADGGEPWGSPGERILVIGAGMAGLAAARELVGAASRTTR